ncbi:hypothetical protein BZG36_04360 [Bifiguratus adelaidae]|uniref:Uncharacterized protein n=1 Tax=Bifiguratus adelaidae TaxID=1938954 RepID=A0A261XVU0_9FUNG|nr:hypothetical protein BZG36_04360 [Bifiguratus adelaidae]
MKIVRSHVSTPPLQTALLFRDPFETPQHSHAPASVPNAPIAPHRQRSRVEHRAASVSPDIVTKRRVDTLDNPFATIDASTDITNHHGFLAELRRSPSPNSPQMEQCTPPPSFMSHVYHGLPNPQRGDSDYFVRNRSPLENKARTHNWSPSPSPPLSPTPRLQSLSTMPTSRTHNSSRVNLRQWCDNLPGTVTDYLQMYKERHFRHTNANTQPMQHSISDWNGRYYTKSNPESFRPNSDAKSSFSMEAVSESNFGYQDEHIESRTRLSPTSRLPSPWTSQTDAFEPLYPHFDEWYPSVDTPRTPRQGSLRASKSVRTDQTSRPHHHVTPLTPPSTNDTRLPASHTIRHRRKIPLDTHDCEHSTQASHSSHTYATRSKTRKAQEYLVEFQ